MAIHDEVVVEASKEMELVDPPLILSSSPVFKRGLKHFKKNLNEICKGFNGPIRKIEKKSGDTVVEEDESGDSDMDMDDDEEIGGSSDEDDDEEEEDGEDHDELGEFRVEDNAVDDEMGIARTCAGVEAASSEGLPARLPTFHTSTLGRWYAVISYDACVRLCLRSLARGCTEAPVFLDKECRLLRRAFGLQHVLLQPEGELLSIRSSIPIIKGSSPKTKKPIGRVDVQVHKLKMDLDSPNGCSFSSLHPSKIKTGALRCCLSNLRSTSSSGVRQETYTCILRSKSSNDDEPVAAKKRSRRHLAETDEFVTSNGEGTLMDVKSTISISFLSNDIWGSSLFLLSSKALHDLLDCIDLPDIISSIYSMELCTRLRAFLVECHPASPSSPVSELVIATAEFQKDLISWNISHGKGGVNAKELFHPYIISWIQHKSLSLLDACKLGVRTQHFTVPFVDYMYDRLKETLSEYELYLLGICTAIADAGKALVVALEKQYEHVLSPFKETLAHKFGLKHVEKLARSACIYEVPEELGVFMNSIKRMIDMLLPGIETRLQLWSSCIPSGCSTVPGELLREIMVMLRSKLRSYLQAIVEKLVDNTKVQNLTKLKKILQEFKETAKESDVQSRLQPLKDQLTKTIVHLHSIFDTRLFLDMCQTYWDRMGQDILSFLDNNKENRACYKGTRIVVSILNDTFASQMQLLLGNALQEKDLAPPKSIMEVRSVLCKDPVNHTGNNHYRWF
ncbi:hypothetical protein C5167_046593 [Papaver somniferum]|uniref:Uncharacterized protein n=1 Tax=Papaver somniferum TaxID=3469 RepID=A0A4Y7LI35_PAPSO|nr:hypothetical protein C5167_046593 [Papaver somniferum]